MFVNDKGDDEFSRRLVSGHSRSAFRAGARDAPVSAAAAVAA
jgi:hypothetical protein